MMWFENLKIALQSILSNKLRSFLTMLGIIIGISSVISIVSIGDSMKGVMDDLYKGFGKNRAYIYIGHVEDLRSTDFFFMDDLDLLKERFEDKLAYIAPSESVQSDVTINKNTIKLNMNCIDANYDKAQEIKMLYGRMISQSDVDRKSKSVVLEQTAAIRLFDKENVVGKTIRVKIENNLEDLLIIGVYKKEVSPMLSLLQGQSTTEDSFVPYTMPFPSNRGYYGLDISINDNYSISTVGEELKSFLANLKHREPENYMFYSAEEDQTSVNGVLGGVSLGVAAIAGISLLVGGIGIMNIMLVSVTERTREIGIKKALGARTKDVLFQFLIESATLSAIGGMVGTALGLGFVMIGGLVISIPIVINPTSIVLAVSFSMVIGISFGYYPAKKAAKSDPIESLRYE
ncbi:MAG: ABC transporter permease [Firmicutes bacterium HGW-Firmicutes-7]|nr:MAG: ABC transporter permease [Firmicutes bacterium HGW-Firmicutes-7]